MFEEAGLECVQPSSRPSALLVGGQPPDRAHKFHGQERALQYLKLAILLSALGIDGGEPPPHGVADTCTFLLYEFKLCPSPILFHVHYRRRRWLQPESDGPSFRVIVQALRLSEAAEAFGPLSNGGPMGSGVFVLKQPEN
jgi:hypothetical protein